MKELRKDWQANHVIAWGGCMNPYRLHALAYRPAPRRRVNLFRRVLRRLIGALT